MVFLLFIDSRVTLYPLQVFFILYKKRSISAPLPTLKVEIIKSIVIYKIPEGGFEPPTAPF